MNLKQTSLTVPFTILIAWDIQDDEGPTLPRKGEAGYLQALSDLRLPATVKFEPNVLRQIARAEDEDMFILDYLSDNYDFLVEGYDILEFIAVKDIPHPHVTVTDNDTGETDVIDMVDIVRETNTDHYTAYTTLDIDSITVYYPSSRTEYRFLSVNMKDGKSYYWQHNLNPQNRPTLTRDPA